MPETSLISNISVGSITACYNAGKFFSECLEGLMGQTHLPKIITVIDDGSTDDSVLIIRNTIEKFARQHNGTIYAKPTGDDLSLLGRMNGVDVIFLPQKQNRGPAAARNVGLNVLLQQVDVIAVADCDDIYYPEKIAKSIEVMANFPEVCLVYSDYDTLNTGTGKEIREWKEIFSYKRLFEECIVSNNSLYASSVIKMIGRYDETLWGPEDYDLWLRIAEVASVYHLPEALYKYRITGDNLTVQTPSEKFAQHVRRVHQKAEERRRGVKHAQ